MSLVLLCGVLSGIETAIAASSLEKIIQKRPNLSQLVIKKIDKLLKQKEQIITSILIAFTVLSTIAITISTSALIDTFGKETGQTIASIVMSVVLLLFSEIVPKIVAVSNTEIIIIKTLVIMQTLLIVFLPVNKMLEYFTSKIIRMFKRQQNK